MVVDDLREPDRERQRRAGEVRAAQPGPGEADDGAEHRRDHRGGGEDCDELQVAVRRLPVLEQQRCRVGADHHELTVAQ